MAAVKYLLTPKILDQDIKESSGESDSGEDSDGNR